MKPIKVIFAMLIVVVCAAFFIATPRIAQAAPLMSSWFFEDDMEGDWSPWECWGSTGSSCLWMTIYSNTPNSSVILRANKGFETVGRRVTLSPFDEDMSCKATMFFRPYSGSGSFSGQLEVIDYNTWNYIKVKTYTYIYLPTPGAWNTVTTASFTPPGPNIFVRMLFNSPTSYKQLEVDLLRISCSW